MKALTYSLPNTRSGSPDLCLFDISIPQAQPGEVLVRVHYAALSYFEVETSMGTRNRAIGAASIVGGALTTINALERIARLGAGSEVLITGSTGSVGVAAYCVAQVGYIGLVDYQRHSPAGWQVFYRSGDCAAIGIDVAGTRCAAQGLAKTTL